MIKISVIVPVYNVEEYLIKCVESILGQTFANLEIILVDDGSTDQSGNICDEFASRDVRIIVLHKENGGVVSARNHAASIMTGDYVVSVDGDDWIEKDYIQNFVDALGQKKWDVIWSVSFIKDGADGKEVQLPGGLGDIPIDKPAIQKELYHKVMGEQGYQNEIEHSNWMKCVRREIYAASQKKVENRLHRGEDLLFSLLILNETDSILFIRNDGYHYIQRPSSVTNDKSACRKEDYAVLEKALENFLSEAERNKENFAALARGYLLITYMNYFFGTKQNSEMTYLYPFEKITIHSRIIVYGAGNIGKNIVSYLQKTSEYELAAWVDKKLSGKLIFDVRIKGVEYIQEAEYDYVVLATNRTMYINEMRCALKKMGVDENKVLSVFDNQCKWVDL